LDQGPPICPGMSIAAVVARVEQITPAQQQLSGVVPLAAGSGWGGPSWNPRKALSGPTNFADLLAAAQSQGPQPATGAPWPPRSRRRDPTGLM
jgi:hypothetical protein